MRLVYNDYTSTFENLLLIDGSVSIHHRNIQKVATEMYKAKNNLSPEITPSNFQQNEVSHLRSDITFLRPTLIQYIMGKDHCEVLANSWNNLLPEEYKSAENVENLKIR